QGEKEAEGRAQQEKEGRPGPRAVAVRAGAGPARLQPLWQEGLGIGGSLSAAKTRSSRSGAALIAAASLQAQRPRRGGGPMSARSTSPTSPRCASRPTTRSRRTAAAAPPAQADARRDGTGPGVETAPQRPALNHEQAGDARRVEAKGVAVAGTRR